MKIKQLFFCLALLFGISSFHRNGDIKPAQILHQMFDSIKNVKTLRTRIAALERVDKRFLTANSEIKLQANPKKLYFVNKVKKIEILYNPEQTGRKALVKPNTFPYITLSLDPTGSLMRKNQHYTIQELGYEYIGISIAFTIKKDKDGIHNFRYLGKYAKNGYNCYMIEYENKLYSYVEYVVGEKETATNIANKLGVNDYLLRYNNNLLNDFGSVKKGRVLKVPNLYCKKAILYIDERLMLPVSISLYDDAGLFESYDYTGIEINKPFKDNEFNRDYKGYGF